MFLLSQTHRKYMQNTHIHMSKVLVLFHVLSAHWLCVNRESIDMCIITCMHAIFCANLLYADSDPFRWFLEADARFTLPHVCVIICCSMCMCICLYARMRTTCLENRKQPHNTEYNYTYRLVMKSDLKTGWFIQLRFNESILQHFHSIFLPIIMGYKHAIFYQFYQHTQNHGER